MKFRHKNIIVTLLALLYTSSLYAVGSFSGVIEYVQADGSHIKVILHGDEYDHWYSDPEGNLLMPTHDGSLIAADEVYKSRFHTKSIRKYPRATSYTKYPTTGEQKVLIILVEYQDRRFSYSADEFRKMLSEPGYSGYGATGSAYDYFVENSAGRFIPDFEVFGPVTLPNNMSYYGSNDDANAHKMVVEACRQLDSEIEFSEYDRDGDGWVDNVYVFYAGYGEADGGSVNSVWPHSANLSTKGEIVMLDGVNIGSYSCSNELIGGTTRLVGIGTFCHEFSHVLGLPDLYSTNNNSAFTPYYYSLMDHGNYNGDGRCPCALTAYERYYLGWCEPRELTTDGSVRLDPISSNIAYRLSLPGYSEEYFLLENRKKEGWDAMLPGEGMLIWHIDYSKDVWNRNAVNNDESRQRVDLIEADGYSTLNTSAGDPFPGTSGVSTFSRFTDHTGAVYPHKLSNIRYDSGSVLFDFNTSSTFPQSVRNLRIADVDDNNFRIEWDAVAAADSYLVSVTCQDSGRDRPQSEYTAFETTGNTLYISGLQPSTEYSCVVRSVKGVSVSETCAPLKVTTAEPGIGYFSPVALGASDITYSGFTANWEAMPQAERYLLDVFTMTEDAVEKEEVSFTTPLTLPDGWTSTATGTMSVNGYYGKAAPSLRFAQNAEVLESPVYNKDIKSISFWMRGYKAAPTSKLVISVLSGDNWRDVEEITDIDNSKGVDWEWYAPADLGQVSAIRLTYYGTSGSSVCVDDVTVNFGFANVKKSVIEKKEVIGATLYAVSGLDQNRDYSYRVYGADGNKLSLPSDEIAVRTLNQGSGVDIIAADIKPGERIYTLTGIALEYNDSLPAGIYIMRRGDKTVKFIK